MNVTSRSVTPQVDTVPPAELPRLLALVRAINPSARLLPTRQSRVPLAEVLNTGRFSLERAREGAGWLKVSGGRAREGAGWRAGGGGGGWRRAGGGGDGGRGEGGVRAG